MYVEQYLVNFISGQKFLIQTFTKTSDFMNIRPYAKSYSEEKPN